MLVTYLYGWGNGRITCSPAGKYVRLAQRLSEHNGKNIFHLLHAADIRLSLTACYFVYTIQLTVFIKITIMIRTIHQPIFLDRWREEKEATLKIFFKRIDSESLQKLYPAGEPLAVANHIIETLS